ncbi:MAG: o-succinylbenzoate synthase [Gammaproteobacteria bacterium]
MKIQHTTLTPYTLPLQQQWRSRQQDLSVRSGWLLELEDTNGTRGYGDCAPLPSHGTETGEKALATLESIVPRLAGIHVADCLEMLPDAKPNPAARCALETALLDLEAQQQNIPLHQHLNPGVRSEVRVNAVIGSLSERSSDLATTAIEHGYSLLKLKVGITEPQHELELLRRLCADLPPSIRLRLDANRAWDHATTQSFLDNIQDLPIESLEEPLSRPDIQLLAQIQEGTDITLALDETVAGMDADKLSQFHSLRRIILKPMVLGGILPSLNLGQNARKLGIEVVVTTTLDSAAGVWAATHLAAALDTEGRLCHGVGTSEWLRRDLGTGPHIQSGTITIPKTPGLGFRPYP